MAAIIPVRPVDAPLPAGENGATRPDRPCPPHPTRHADSAAGPRPGPATAGAVRELPAGALLAARRHGGHGGGGRRARALRRGTVRRPPRVHAIDKWNNLIERQTFSMFFEAPMQIANVRHYIFNNLAIAQYFQSQHTVRRRMLRPEVDDNFLRLQF